MFFDIFVNKLFTATFGRYPFGMLQPGRKYSGGSGYRYGFNGQEKDNEVYGTGNLNTAEYWEYDCRIGRRWNVDLKAKPNRSAYDAFSNNPLVKIDPKGDDDFWSIDQKTGKAILVKQDKNGSNIWIQQGESFVLLSEIEFNTKKDQILLQGVADIIATYAVEAKLKFNYNCDHSDDNIVGGIGVSWEFNVNKDGLEVVAFHNSKDNTIMIPIQQNNHILIDDYWKLEAELIHEDYHKNNIVKTFGDHVEAYLAEITSNAFSKISDRNYMANQIATAYIYLLNDKRESQFKDDPKRFNELEKRFNAQIEKLGFKVEDIPNAKNEHAFYTIQDKTDQSNYVNVPNKVLPNAN